MEQRFGLCVKEKEEQAVFSAGRSCIGGVLFSGRECKKFWPTIWVDGPFESLWQYSFGKTLVGNRKFLETVSSYAFLCWNWKYYKYAIGRGTARIAPALFNIHLNGSLSRGGLSLVQWEYQFKVINTFRWLNGNYVQIIQDIDYPLEKLQEACEDRVSIAEN